MAGQGSGPVALGIDIGGTATRALIVDAAGRRRGAGHSAGANPTAHPPAVWSRALSEALGQALDESGPGAEVRSVVVGVAGDRALADGDGAATFESVIRGRVGGGCPIRMTGDVVVAFASGTPAADGTVLVAGTGAAAAAIKDRAPVSEIDGYGWLLGDAGSGFWIGRQAVRAVLADTDGRGPATGLRPLVTDALLGRGFAEPSARRMCLEIVNAAHARPPVDLSRLAPLVSRCAGAGDQVALLIARTAVGHLVASVLAVRPARAATPLVVTGGVAAGDHPVAGLLRERLEDRWPGCVRSAHDGVAGATWLALTAMPGADQAEAAELHQVVAAASRRLPSHLPSGPLAESDRADAGEGAHGPGGGRVFLPRTGRAGDVGGVVAGALHRVHGLRIVAGLFSPGQRGGGAGCRARDRGRGRARLPAPGWIGRPDAVRPLPQPCRPRPGAACPAGGSAAFVPQVARRRVAAG
jgi:N-acetylglucosamine kinase-like BadF-type ATPase